MSVQQFHEGEQRIRSRAQLDAHILAMSQYYRPYMPEQHRELFEKLPFMVLGALDAEGQPWATLLEGPPGFVSAVDERHLRLHATLPPVDPLAASLRPGSRVGLLGIEPRTRRRNRANGFIEQATPAFFDVAVQQSFGNCPKYIQARTVDYLLTHNRSAQAQRVDSSAKVFKEIVAQADIFFIASAHPRATNDRSPEHGVDVSHRGGRAGFIQTYGDTLTVDDYIGNNFFNTVGNLELNPRTGLLFVEIDSGALLHIAARAEIEWLATPKTDRKGTNRRLHFHIEDALYVTDRSALQWGAAELSPFV